MLDPVIFTEGAADKVREILVEEGNLNLKLRVYVTGADVPGSSMDFPSRNLWPRMIRWSPEMG